MLIGIPPFYSDLEGLTSILAINYELRFPKYYYISNEAKDFMQRVILKIIVELINLNYFVSY